MHQYQMMMSRKDLLKSHVFSWRRMVCSEWEDVTSSGMALFSEIVDIFLINYVLNVVLMDRIYVAAMSRESNNQKELQVKAGDVIEVPVG